MASQGLQYLPPQPGAKFQVIGAGLPRSGTNSFCAAISLLLNGPAYQSAVQSALAPTPHHVLTLTKLLHLRTTTPPPHPELLPLLQSEMTGYVACADTPLCLFTPELLTLHPSAIVICTIRDKHKWAASMWKAARLGNPTILKWLWFWVPVLRYSPAMWAAQAPVYREICDGVNMDSYEGCKVVWERYHEWLRRVVPEEKLFFVDLREGWGPVCRALGVRVPDGEFPRLNDATALEKTMKDFSMQGLVRWLGFVGVVGLVLGILGYLLI